MPCASSRSTSFSNSPVSKRFDLVFSLIEFLQVGTDFRRYRIRTFGNEVMMQTRDNAMSLGDQQQIIPIQVSSE